MAFKRFTAALAAGLMAGALGGTAAAEPEIFQVRTTADLIALCSVPENHADYVAAIHFCHGFAVGAYQYYWVLAGGEGGVRLVCLPDPPPARDAVIEDFVRWAQARPEYHDEAPVESIMRYLIGQYPCR
ncbi:MAG: hypothetical protein EA405_15225 [Rhodospirillales bacterium]|nr:MAG: hypothetical protein EA405_15225 [Rhodospirillales bacterium]TVR98127.1 MAG: hypothetical protein EA406_07785 [Rhodospirillales bacterium]